MLGNGTAKSISPKKLAKIAGQQLREVNGPNVAVFDLSGFDTHADQGGSFGQHADNLQIGRNTWRLEPVTWKRNQQHIDRFAH